MAFEDLNNKTDGIFDDILPNTHLRRTIRSPNNGFYYGAYHAKDMLKTDSKRNQSKYWTIWEFKGMQGH